MSTHGEATRSRTVTVLGYVAAGLGLFLLVAMSPFFLSAGLVAPLWAVVALNALWIGLMVLGVVWFRRRPFVVLAFPVLAAVVWWATMTAGEAWLGWRP